MKKITYKKLEEKFVLYRDLIDIKVLDNGEPLLPLDSKEISFGYLPEMADMVALIGKNILVRKSVKERLNQAQSFLKGSNPNLSLYITYGFRDLSIQKMRFLKRLDIIAKEFYENPIDLYEAVHRSVAVPTVAGHPTGGAVDITIVNTKTGKFLDLGTSLYDYSTKDCYVFSPKVSKETYRNRMLLRSCMNEAGFAPYDAEWWHFSYGDKEWAYYYKKTNALYKQLKKTGDKYE